MSRFAWPRLALPWTTLTHAGRSKVLRSSYFWLFVVPILAHLTSSLNERITIPLWRSELVIQLVLPFSWKMFYFAAVAFAVASAIYALRCPALIRHYDKYSEFESEGKGSRELINALLEYYGDDSPEHQNLRRQFVELHGTAAKKPFQVVRKHMHTNYVRQPQSDAFWWIREHIDNMSPLSRLFCGAFYFLGGVFGLIVVGQGFLYVLRVL